MNSDCVDPLSIGSDEMVSINQLVDFVEDIAGVKLKRSYNLDAPKGVRGVAACCRPRMIGHGQGFPRAAMNSRGERYPRALCG